MIKKRNKIYLREATEDDCEILWKWRNEEETRESSFNEEFIPFEEHKKWFYNKLNDKNTKIYIALNEEEKPIGQIRLEINNENAEINIGIDRDKRGKGYGTEILKKASVMAFSELKLKKIVGYIKEDNMKSIQAFKKAGFINNGLKMIKGYNSIEMILEK